MNRNRLAFLVALLFLGGACSKAEKPVAETRAAILPVDDSMPQEGGTVLRRLAGDIATLNPVMSTSRYDRLLTNLLFTPLVYLDINLNPIPGLAKSWEIAPDGKSYTFHLDPKATFEDHTPVRASDVLYTVRKIVDPEAEAAQFAGGFEKFDSKNSHVVDDHTVVLAFTEALATQFVEFNNVLTIPEHVYSVGDFRTAFISRVVGNGPYHLVRRVPGKEILLERREDYWAKKPYIKDVLFKVIVDDATAWNAVKRGEIDETAITSDMWQSEHTRPELLRYLDFRRFYTLNYNYIGWNGRNPLFADKRMRRAMSMCVDLGSLINNLYHGTARAMSGPFTPDQWAYNPTVPVVAYDPDGAQRMLASMGWLDTNGDGILDHNGKPLQFEMLIFAGSQTAIAFSQLFQAELRKIGVDVRVAVLEPSVLIQRVLAGKYDAAYLSWELDPDPDPFKTMHSSQFAPHGQNFVFYANPEADQLMADGQREMNQTKRKAIYQRLHEVLAEDQPYTWTLQVSYKHVLNRRLRNVKESPQYGLFLWYPGELDWWISRSPQRAAMLSAR